MQAFLAALLGLTLAAAPAAAQIRLGLAGPVTGANAVFGMQMRAGAEQAVADLNARGGVLGQQLALDVGDDACDPKQAVSVANRLAHDSVPVVIGHFCSTASIAARAVYGDEGVLQISPASASNRFTDDGNWGTFRTCGRDDQQGRFAGHTLATEFKDQAVAILHDNSTFGKGIADATRGFMNAAGKQEALYAAYTPGEYDYTALISRLKQARIAVVYIGGYHSDVGLFARQAREQGLDAQFLGSSALQTKELWRVGGTAIEGFRHAFYADPRTLASAADIVRVFDARQVDPEGFTLYAYAAVQVWAQAAAKAGTTDAHAVAAALKASGPFATALGDMAFDAKGDPVGNAYVWYVWHDGTYRPM
jgi:branched-chain amino acid transport system substrate-binding protein